MVLIRRGTNGLYFALGNSINSIDVDSQKQFRNKMTLSQGSWNQNSI